MVPLNWLSNKPLLATGWLLDVINKEEWMAYKETNNLSWPRSGNCSAELIVIQIPAHKMGLLLL